MSREPAPEGSLPPAVVAARQARRLAAPRRGGARAYPLVDASADVPALAAELAATQAVLVADTPEQLAAIVATLVRDLGGALVLARLADPASTVQLDVSLGLSEPLLPFADPVSVVAMRLNAVLPGFVERARLALSRLQGEAQRDDEATKDVLTGLLTRRAWMRRLSAAAQGDGLCLIDLDRFKDVNDTSGHQAGDAVLRALGGLLSRSFRDDDSCGRYGGDELVCLAPGLGAAGLGARCEVLRRAWEQERPVVGASVGLSIGVSQVGEQGGRAALHAADAAMYLAKSGGRNRTVLAADTEPAADGGGTEDFG